MIRLLGDAFISALVGPKVSDFLNDLPERVERNERIKQLNERAEHFEARANEELSKSR